MTRRVRDPEAVARLDRLFREAPPEWQEFFDELDRRDPKMKGIWPMQIVEGLKHVLRRGRNTIAKRFEASSMPVDVAASALLFSALSCDFRRAPVRDIGELPDADGMVGVRPGELVRALFLVPDADTGSICLDAVRFCAKRVGAIQAGVSHDDRPYSLTIGRQDGNKVMFAAVRPNSMDSIRSTWVAGAIFDRRLPDMVPEATLLDATAAVKLRLLHGALFSFVALC